jgi:hypothetical protein
VTAWDMMKKGNKTQTFFKVETKREKLENRKCLTQYEKSQQE